MTSIQYDREGISLSVEGHAGFAERGADLICATITILFYTLVENVNRLKLRYRGDGGSDLESGSGSVWYNAINNIDAEAAREVFDAVSLGFELMAEHYPDYVMYEEI